jgi:hypothetical protein
VEQNPVTKRLNSCNSRLTLTAPSDAPLVQKLVPNDLLIPESLSEKFLESRQTGHIRLCAVSEIEDRGHLSLERETAKKIGL